MTGIVEVQDKDTKGFLTVELGDLLRIIEPRGRNLIWSILDLEARSDPAKFKGDLAAMEQQIKLSPNGLIIGWDDLLTLSDALIEVLDGVFVGCKDRDSIPRLIPGDEVFSQCEIGIEAVDSSMWRVYAREDAILDKISAAFREVTLVRGSPPTK
jgi:hypothetical protein